MGTLVQSRSVEGNDVASLSLAFLSNVVAGNLIILTFHDDTATDDAIVVGDITKPDGTATLGTITLDRSQRNLATSVKGDVIIASVPVIAGGSCTMQVSGRPSDTFCNLVIMEWTIGDVSATRVEDVDGANGDLQVMDTNNAVSAGAAVFIAAWTSVDTDTQVLTPDAAWTQVYEQENGASFNRASSIYRVTAIGLTDSGTWTNATGADQFACCMVVYKDVAGAAPTTKKFQRASVLG